MSQMHLTALELENKLLPLAWSVQMRVKIASVFFILLED